MIKCSHYKFLELDGESLEELIQEVLNNIEEAKSSQYSERIADFLRVNSLIFNTPKLKIDTSKAEVKQSVNFIS